MTVSNQRIRHPLLPRLAFSLALAWPIVDIARSLLPALLLLGVAGFGTVDGHAADLTPRFAVKELALRAATSYANPYTGCTAQVLLTEPDGKTTRSTFLFWDGDGTWKFRFAPDKTGLWRWAVTSTDRGLDGQRGQFECRASDRRGSIRPMQGFPYHFQRDDGSPFWFMGDTAWSLYTDSPEKHDRAAAFAYLDARAAQGFNVVHSMLMCESGDGNRGGPPFADISREELNPAYWREVDLRVAHANQHGIVAGLALAWGNKRNTEKWPWGRFPDVEARKRYARYIAARYSAFEVYFIISGEWHAEVRHRRGMTEEAVRQEFIAIGDALHAADPHGRMVAIHPMTASGSVRDFNTAQWMSFGDYQQNYSNLHARLLESRRFAKPVVNSEYAYYLRDRDADGLVDKPNSASIDDIRAATWDIVMAGGYPVTGFGTTYMGGHRDPGPFDLHAEKNRVWEQQIGYVKRFFTNLEWWKLEPHDELVSSSTPRGKDGQRTVSSGRRTHRVKQPPGKTYWCLADPGRCYVVYVRGLNKPVTLSLKAHSGLVHATQWDPRTGQSKTVTPHRSGSQLHYQPPDDQGWVLLIERASTGS